jgi:hypothetical protein
MKLMAFKFDVIKAQHVILFFVHSLGGATDISRLFLLLYLADLRHLANHGALILGDGYMAMKYGPAPIHIHTMLSELQGEQGKGPLHPRNKQPFLINEQKQLVALLNYSTQQLADSEVECIFNVIHQYKDDTVAHLGMVTKDTAWNKADGNGVMDLLDMAIASGAGKEMIRYIRQAYKND